MKETENYGLVLPEKDDFYNIDDFNGNTIKIDAKLKEADDKVKNISIGIDNKPAFDYLTVGTRGEGDIGENSFSSGTNNVASGNNSQATGSNTKALGEASNAHGTYNVSATPNSYTEGKLNLATEGTTYFITSFDNTLKRITLDKVTGLSTSSKLDIKIKGSNSITDIQITSIDGLNVTLNTTEPITSNWQYAVLRKSSNIHTSHAEGLDNLASGECSHAEGAYTAAIGSCSHAEGAFTIAGEKAHAEGYDCFALGEFSHAEGYGTRAPGNYSHAEGFYTLSDANSHAEGIRTYAGNSTLYRITDFDDTAKTIKVEKLSPTADVAVGSKINIIKKGSHFKVLYSIRVTAISGDTLTLDTTETIDSSWTHATLPYGTLTAHAEGYETIASGTFSHTEGYQTLAIGEKSHAEGDRTTAKGPNSHGEGQHSQAIGTASHAEGYNCIASGTYSHAEGSKTRAYGSFSHAEGANSAAVSAISHAEGMYTFSGVSTVHNVLSYNNTTKTLTLDSALGLTVGDDVWVRFGEDGFIYTKITTISGVTVTINTTESLSNASHVFKKLEEAEPTHAEGHLTIATGGGGAHSEGSHTIALGQHSHAEGYLTVASGVAAHAEGHSTTASGDRSHAGGHNTWAKHANTFVHGFSIESGTTEQAVFGRYNQPNNSALMVVGNGTSNNARSNAMVLYPNGNLHTGGHQYGAAIATNITLSPGFTANSSCVTVRTGRIVCLHFHVSGTINANTDVLIGTIGDVIARPSINIFSPCTGGNASVAGQFWVTTSGQIYVKFTAAQSYASGSITFITYNSDT